MFGLGVPELLVIFVILIVLFGGSRIPKLAHSLGASFAEFRNGLKGSRQLKPSEPRDITDESTT